jgi:hypothetical protein
MTTPPMQRRHQSAAGAIYVPEAPLFAQPDDDLLRGLETLLFLTWDPAEPGPWFARLAAFPLAGGAFLLAWERDGGAPQLVARLAPARPAPAGINIWQIFLRDFLANPAAFHAEPLDAGLLPQTITNYRPDLLTRAAVRAALAALDPPNDYFTAAYEEER